MVQNRYSETVLFLTHKKLKFKTLIACTQTQLLLYRNIAHKVCFVKTIWLEAFFNGGFLTNFKYLTH